MSRWESFAPRALSAMMRSLTKAALIAALATEKALDSQSAVVPPSDSQSAKRPFQAPTHC